jgi:ABC-2 type transport system ATP-binding protein
MLSNSAIVLEKLSKKYSKSEVFALKDVSLNVNEGEVYGFLGPNGAGKSTTIKTLLNFIQPTSGSAKILGLDIVNDSVEIKRHIGYLSGDFAAYPKMTGAQFIEYMGELQPPVSKKYVNELIRRFKAEPGKKLGALSRGNLQKFGIIQAFMHQPDVIILDEPTSGLDPLMQQEFYNLVNESKARGAAVFLSSHILSEVQKTCDRIGIIREGKLVEERKISEMSLEASQTFDISFNGKVPISELKKIRGARVSEHTTDSVTIHMHGKLSDLFVVLAKSDVTKIDARNLDLDELFLGLYEGKNKK